ncbi:hypothetical protein [Ramlibacter sp. Leaf400]|uniref:hypothetical protein n=1 Tax=Ramlibacter sp. Leaf400 TaxID=1736365 RepID=UPI0012E3C52B|nr:hypothetical protein [Ramlibacter sp. Leaf400]
MKRDLPLPLQLEEEGEEHAPRSMLASRTVWIGGALSLAAWAVLAWVIKAV